MEIKNLLIITMKKKITIILEKSGSSYLGRVTFQDNLIIESARTIEGLSVKVKKLLVNFHDIDANLIEFDFRYDLTVLFDAFNYLKISTVAQMAGINPSLLRQYATGIKHPSEAQAKKIESTLHSIGRDLLKAYIFTD